MKLNLSPSQASAMACTIPTLPPASAPGVIITAALQAMRAAGHAPFTRRDVFAVVAASATPVDVDTLKEAWKRTPSFPRVKSAGRGYLDYPPNLGGRLASFDARAPAPKVILTESQLGDLTIISRAGVVFVPAMPELDETTVYNHDTGLAQMAAQATPCFGLYEAGHKTCGGCPLQASCAPATYSRIEEIARDLDIALQATLTKLVGISVEEAAAEAAAVDLHREDLGLQAPYADGAVRRVAPFDAPCSGCGVVISAGDDGIHVPDKGYYHEACADLSGPTS